MELLTEKTAMHKLPMVGLYHLFVIYIVWSSTYLAIRVAVKAGSGFAPFSMGASRLLLAGLILLLIAALRKDQLLPSKSDLPKLIISGSLLWFVSHAALVWSEQHANSGFAALIIATTPIWTALFSAIITKKLPSLRLVASLLFGFCGLIVLMAQALFTGSRTELTAVLGLLCSSVCWSLGSLYQTRHPINLSPGVTSGYQMLMGSIGLLVLTFSCKEPLPNPTGAAWAAWLYLVIIGSVFAYTSFTKALRLLPINIVMTYAYVNPVLALCLGWWLLGETVSTTTAIGASMVIFAVFGIFSAQAKQVKASPQIAEAG